MAHAIIVAGNSKRFLDQARVLQHYLRLVKVPSGQIITTAYRKVSQIFGILLRRLEEIPADEVCLLAFMGHGKEDGWHMSDSEEFTYTHLFISVCLFGSRPILILNDCCHSGALIEKLKTAPGLEKKVGVIAACGMDETAYPGLANAVIDSWGRKTAYEPIQVTEEVFVINDFGYTVQEIAGTKIVLAKPVDEKAPYNKIVVRLNPCRWGAVLDEHYFPKM